MAHPTQSGELRVIGFLLFLGSCSFGYAQSTPLSCYASAVPTLVRSEGLTERTGDVVLQCSGGTAGTVVSGNLNLFLTAEVTNRVNADSVAADLALAIDTGAGSPAAVAGRIAGRTVSFNGVSFTVPPSLAATLRITNLRINASQLGLDAQVPVQAMITANLTPLTIFNNPLTVARTTRGLLAAQSGAGITCTGSPLPGQPGFESLLAAGTIFASTRVTEGFADAFQPKDPTSDTGTRIIVRYTGIPAAAHLFVPDAIAGSDALAPTAAGDFGGTVSGGRYEPSAAGSLLLSRVDGAEANGAGGTPVYTPGAPGSGTVPLDSVGQLTASSTGDAYVVYEIVDANPMTPESAQFPTFVGMPSVNATAAIGWSVFLAPVSGQGTASATAPIPRFVAAGPAPDCPMMGDCSADYFPHLAVQSNPLQLSATSGGSRWDRAGYIVVRNQGGGMMPWTATVTYKSGSGWLALDPPSGTSSRSLEVAPAAQKLAPGSYEAVITIDAGAAGLVNVPVTLAVTATPPVTPGGTTPPVTPEPPHAMPMLSVTGIANTADSVFGPLAPGAQAMVMGSNLGGGAVSVTFDGIPAKVLAPGWSGIKVIVPPELGTRSSAMMVVTVDGVSSAPSLVTLAPFTPAVFRPGILNADGSINGAGAPAAPGSEVVVLTTGLAGVDPGSVTVKIHDRDNLRPFFVGPVEGADGVQQVHITVPDGLQPMTADIFVCAPGPAGRACSYPSPIVLGQ